MAESYGSCILNFLRHSPSILPKQSYRFTSVSAACEKEFQQVLPSTCCGHCFILAILIGAQQYRIVLFTRISLVTNNIWRLFMYLFAICVIFCFFDEVCSNLWPFFKIYFLLCVYFCLCRIFIAEHGLSLALASGAVPQLWVRGLLSSLASLVAAHGLRAWAWEIWHAGLAAF